MISAIIPTKNRLLSLMEAVRSIIRQDCLPSELIIIDQSEEPCNQVLSELVKNQNIKLKYIHDTTISSLVEAKKIGITEVTQDIICFLEDDIILDHDYFSAVLEGFERREGMVGCCGIIKNQPHSSWLYKFFHGFFFRGILYDPRIKIFDSFTTGLVPCNMLSGGLSSWRACVFREVEFDVENGFFMLEDVEFSTRVGRVFEFGLFVNAAAKAFHELSSLNRLDHGARQRQKIKEAVLFYKKRKNWDGALMGLTLALLWWLAEAVLRSFQTISFRPLVGGVTGLLDGITAKIKASCNEE